MRRRWPLAAVSFTVVGLHVVWMAAVVVAPPLPGRPAATTDRDSGSRAIRVFFQNVWLHNRDLSDTLSEVTTEHPDVVALVEYSRELHPATESAVELQDYPHRTTVDGVFKGQAVIYSKLPIAVCRRRWVSHRLVLDVDLAIGGDTMRLVVLHAPRPLYRQAAACEKYWDQVLVWIAENSGPTLVVGDFNLTPHAKRYRQMVGLGLRDAFRVAGKGWQTTWPNGRSWIPPIRIDHALISNQVECVDIRPGRGLSSDHRPVIVDVRIEL